MKLTFLFAIIIIASSFKIAAQSNYYWSLDKKVSVEQDYKIVTLKYKNDLNRKGVSIQLGINENDIIKVERIHEKLVRVDFKDASSVLSASENKKMTIIPSLILGKEYSLPVLMTGEITILPNKKTDLDAIIQKYDLSLISELNYGAYLLAVKNESETLEIANAIQENEEVEWANPDFIAEMTTNNDPLYTNQYYLKNTGQFGGTAGMDIKAEQAWAITKGCNIRVAVLDVGMEAHEEFTDRVLPGYTAGSSSGNGAPISAGANHGVQCAGIIGASHDNFVGIKGIAPKVLLIPVRIFGENISASQLAEAITWAYSSSGGKADVLSNSWGYSNSSFSDSDISTAISNARTLGRDSKGTVVVFSSGNYNNSWSGVQFPAKLPGVITVGAINNQGDIWSYSSRGPEMDLVAPSGNTDDNGDVQTTDRMGTNGGTSGNYINTFGGTSAAAPQVAGVVALMLSVNPILTELGVRNILNQTATEMGISGFDNTYGYGRVNAEAAVMGAYPVIIGPGVCTPQTFSVFGLPSTASISWSSDNTSALTINSSGLATRVGSYNGYVTIRATISGGCVTYSQITKNVKVGSPDLIKKVNGNVAGTTPVAAGNLYSLTASSSMSPVNFNYSNYTGSGNINIDLYSPNSFETQMYVSSTSTSGSRYVRVSASNTCGSYYEDFVFYLIGGSLRVYPNPANDILTVELVSLKSPEFLPETITLISEKTGLAVETISIKDSYERARLNGANKMELNLLNLPRGTYYLQSTTKQKSGEKTERMRILLK